MIWDWILVESLALGAGIGMWMLFGLILDVVDRWIE